jgi:hypothetical protein
LTVQAVAVALIVIGAAGYTAWTLMPAPWRRGLARRLLRTPGLAAWSALRRAASAPAGCGCSGCDGAPSAPAAAAQPIKVVRRPR